MSPLKTIKPGDTFFTRSGTRVDTFRREEDDPAPVFDCERIRVTHLSCSTALAKGWKPYTFGTEPRWFEARGLAVAEKA